VHVPLVGNRSFRKSLDTNCCEESGEAVSQYKERSLGEESFIDKPDSSAGSPDSRHGAEEDFHYDEKENANIILNYLRNESHRLQMLVAKLQSTKRQEQGTVGIKQLL
jgi:hypothetical protein